jgi:hypothetical protein
VELPILVFIDIIYQIMLVDSNFQKEGLALLELSCEQKDVVDIPNITNKKIKASNFIRMLVQNFIFTTVNLDNKEFTYSNTLIAMVVPLYIRLERDLTQLRSPIFIKLLQNIFLSGLRQNFIAYLINKSVTNFVFLKKLMIFCEMGLRFIIIIIQHFPILYKTSIPRIC